nr:MAG TPA: hypothetical protein [Caudoviricetes sp.]
MRLSESFKSCTDAFILASASVALCVSACTDATISVSFNLRSEIDLLVLSFNSVTDVFIAASSALALDISESNLVFKELEDSVADALISSITTFNVLSL